MSIDSIIPDIKILQLKPRNIGRKNIGWNIENIPFSGIDIWNCYEFSFLEKSGKPFVGILRITYPADSEFIVESKSLKLYLNSYNMTILKNKVEALHMIENDLKISLKISKVKLEILNYYNFHQEFTQDNNFKCIDNLNSNNSFQYEVNANLLNTKPIEKQEHFLMSNLLKSNCPITNQPDWGSIYIYYFADKKEIKEESLLNYIVSYRNHNEFHEECCERILFDLVNKIQPRKIIVLCKYNRRGGIDINPLRIYPREKFLLQNLPDQIIELLYFREFRQ